MSDRWTRKDGESEYAYIYRIGQAKDLIGSWQDVADLINGQLGYEYTESKYRKDYNAFKKMFEANRDQLVDTDEQLSLIDQKQMDLKKEARKFYDQRQALTRVLTQQARQESLQSCIEAAAERLNERYPLVSILPDDGWRTAGGTEAVLCLTDWHYGMVCDNVFNEYNPEICIKRVNAMVNAAADRIQRCGVTVLHILLLGDFAHGAIHPSVRIESTEDVCDQLMTVSEVIAQVIHALSQEVEETHVYSTYGNHMRTVQDKKSSKHSDNMEKIIPWWLKQRLASENVVFHESTDEFILLEVCDKLILATHGDLDSVRDLGITGSMLFAKKYGKPVDYAIMGDKHHVETIDRFGVESMIAPALCGADDYASSKRLYSNPAQMMITFEPEYGRDAVYYLKLEC